MLLKYYHFYSDHRGVVESTQNERWVDFRRLWFRLEVGQKGGVIALINLMGSIILIVSIDLTHLIDLIG